MRRACAIVLIGSCISIGWQSVREDTTPNAYFFTICHPLFLLHTGRYHTIPYDAHMCAWSKVQVLKVKLCYILIVAWLQSYFGYMKCREGQPMITGHTGLDDHIMRNRCQFMELSHADY